MIEAGIFLILTVQITEGAYIYALPRALIDYVDVIKCYDEHEIEKCRFRLQELPSKTTFVNSNVRIDTNEKGLLIKPCIPLKLTLENNKIAFYPHMYQYWGRRFASKIQGLNATAQCTTDVLISTGLKINTTIVMELTAETNQYLDGQDVGLSVHNHTFSQGRQIKNNNEENANRVEENLRLMLTEKLQSVLIKIAYNRADYQIRGSKDISVITFLVCGGEVQEGYQLKPRKAWRKNHVIVTDAQTGIKPLINGITWRNLTHESFTDAVNASEDQAPVTAEFMMGNKLILFKAFQQNTVIEQKLTDSRGKVLKMDTIPFHKGHMPDNSYTVKVTPVIRKNASLLTIKHNGRKDVWFQYLPAKLANWQENFVMDPTVSYFDFPLQKYDTTYFEHNCKQTTKVQVVVRPKQDTFLHDGMTSSTQVLIVVGSTFGTALVLVILCIGGVAATELICKRDSGQFYNLPRRTPSVAPAIPRRGF